MAPLTTCFSCSRSYFWVFFNIEISTLFDGLIVVQAYEYSTIHWFILLSVDFQTVLMFQDCSSCCDKHSCLCACMCPHMCVSAHVHEALDGGRLAGWKHQLHNSSHLCGRQSESGVLGRNIIVQWLSISSCLHVFYVWNALHNLKIYEPTWL